MTRNISTDAEIDSVRLTQQISHPSSPSSGYESLYVISGSPHGGLFLKDSSGRQIGPFITGSAAGAGSSFSFFGIVDFTAPATSGWTWDNQGTSTIDSAEGYEYMVAPKQSAVRISMRYRTPVNTNWSIRVCGLYDISGTPDGSGGDSGFFIGWRDSAGKWVTFGTQIQGAAGTVAFYSHKWTSATAYSAAYDSHTSAGINRNPIWLRADYDGTNIVSYYSIDGKHWIQFFSTTLTNFLASGTPNFGWGGYVNGSDNEIALLHYEEVAL